MILRDDRQAALNQLAMACQNAADHYRDVAELLDDPGLERLFQELAGERQQAADALAGQLRRLGDLPQAPDGDWEAVDGLLTRVKTLLAEDRRRALLEEQERREAELAERVEAALDLELPAAARAALEALRRQVTATRSRLAAARAG